MQQLVMVKSLVYMLQSSAVTEIRKLEVLPTKNTKSDDISASSAGKPP